MRLIRRIKPKIKFINAWKAHDEDDCSFSFFKPETGIYPSLIHLVLIPIKIDLFTNKEWIEDEEYQVSYIIHISIFGFGPEFTLDIEFR